jgi:hypothetical protein
MLRKPQYVVQFALGILSIATNVRPARFLRGFFMEIAEGAPVIGVDLAEGRDKTVYVLGSGMLDNLSEKLRAALRGRDDIVIVDKLPEFAGSFDLPPREPSAYFERAAWNAAVDAKNAERKARRAA